MKNVIEIDGKKLHAGMIAEAKKAVAGKGDGRISKADAEKIKKHLENDPNELGYRTIEHIQNNFAVTELAQNVFNTPMNILSVDFKEGDIIVLTSKKDTTAFPNDFQNNISLNVRGSGGANNTPVQGWKYTADNIASQWMLIANPTYPKENGKTTHWHLANMGNGDFLDVNGGLVTEGRGIVTYESGNLSSADRSSVTWKFITQKSINPYGDERWFGIQNVKSGKYISINPKMAHQEKWVGYDGQYWTAFKLKNVTPYKYIPQTFIPNTPQLKNRNPQGGHTTEMVSAGYTYVSYCRCKDDAKPQAWRIQNSPYYKLYRYVYWKCVSWGNNPTSEVQNPSYKTSDQAGFTKTEQETFSLKVGVSLSVSAGEPGIESVSAEVSTELGFSNTTSFTQSFAHTETRTYPCNIPPNSAAGVWLMVNKYRLMRIDNGVEVEVYSKDVSDGKNVAFTQYPEPKGGNMSYSDNLNKIDIG